MLYSSTRYCGTFAAPQIIVFRLSPHIFLPNFLESVSAISASAGTSTIIVGRKVAQSRNIFLLSRQIRIVLPV